MRKTNFFIPILKEISSDASIISHQLMLKAGLIRQLTSGIYTWLPLGYKILRNLENIVRGEMEKIGYSELLMSCIQPASLWKESGRYDDYGPEMLRISDRHDHEMLFGPTNEEVASDIFRKNIHSYKDLPLYIYQMQWKFRDEIRPRFGVMRGREFYMKDGYSFDLDEKSAYETYNKIFGAYNNIFSRMSLDAIAIMADSGPIGGNLNHEFHILAETGESLIYYDKNYKSKKFQTIDEMKNIFAVTEDKYDPTKLPISIDDIEQRRGIEIGHIFYFGTKYSEAMNIKIKVRDEEPKFVHMGSYGIGVSRLIAAIIEVYHDEYGIKWPLSVAPFKVTIINLDMSNKITNEISEKIYKKLRENNIDVLYDDEEKSPGNKFANNDLIGIPWQIIVGPKNAPQYEVELKERSSGKREIVKLESAIEKILTICNANDKSI